MYVETGACTVAAITCSCVNEAFLYSLVYLPRLKNKIIKKEGTLNTILLLYKEKPSLSICGMRLRVWNVCIVLLRYIRLSAKHGVIVDPCRLQSLGSWPSDTVIQGFEFRCYLNSLNFRGPVNRQNLSLLSFHPFLVKQACYIWVKSDYESIIRNFSWNYSLEVIYYVAKVPAQ